MSSKQTNEKELIRELAELLAETGLSEIEIEHKGLRVRVARQISIAASPVLGAGGAPVQVAPAATTGAGSPAATGGESNYGPDHPGAVPSPMVGTTYWAPEPGMEPFVKVGSTVTKGQTIMIVEAMKTMNHIPSPRDGTVRAILVEDGQPVEYGEALVVIE